MFTKNYKKNLFVSNKRIFIKTLSYDSKQIKHEEIKKNHFSIRIVNLNIKNNKNNDLLECNILYTNRNGRFKSSIYRTNNNF